MDDQQLSRQQFALLTHISLSTLSNIFNGRSRPTINQVTAIMESFPSINPKWLLNGSGEMFLANDTPENTDNDPDNAFSEPSLFNSFNPSPTPPPDTVAKKTIPPAEPPSPETIVKEVKVIETKIRQITEIRVFYEDQTWETFIPKK